MDVTGSIVGSKASGVKNEMHVMSANGYKRTFGLAVIHVCFAPESGHPARYEKCNFGRAPEYPLSG
jgi:hypothetical protein